MPDETKLSIDIKIGEAVLLPLFLYPMMYTEIEINKDISSRIY